MPRADLPAAEVTAKLLAFAGRRWGDAAGRALRARHDADAAPRARAARTARSPPASSSTCAETRAACSARRCPPRRSSSTAATSSRSAALHAPERTYQARRGVATRLPLVVLVDRGTASSAEVVAAALRDDHRAEIVGTRTYGKALVQSVDPLEDGGALELTVAHYYTPSGADISGTGVRPDVRASDRRGTPADEALAAALRTLARPAS